VTPEPPPTEKQIAYIERMMKRLRKTGRHDAFLAHFATPQQSAKQAR
jgi:hypothetical protein